MPKLPGMIAIRFENEINRAKEAGAYLIILVESVITDALSLEYLPWFKVTHKSKVTADFLFHRIRSLIQKYDNLQFLFVDGRAEFADMIKKVFFSAGVFRQIDIQLAYDLKVL